MGTRADFYIGRGADAEWLGSIGWDGYPEGIPDAIKNATDETVFRAAVVDFIEERDDGTKPSDGWPWPWDNSCTTDFAYAFDQSCVNACCFGGVWFDPNEERVDEDEPEGEAAIFPDMSSVEKGDIFGKGSGLIVLGLPGK